LIAQGVYFESVVRRTSDVRRTFWDKTISGVNSPAVYGWVTDDIKFAGGRLRPFEIRKYYKTEFLEQSG
jgi:hypothetical protein